MIGTYPQSAPLDFWCGSYTADSEGMGLGIGVIRAGGSGTLSWLGNAAAAGSPSFLAQHPSLPVVYAVAEAEGTVCAYRLVSARDLPGGTALESRCRRVLPIRLEPFGDPWPAGAAACHVAVDRAGRYLTVCCWGDGSVLLYELDSSGAITARFAAGSASDPHGETGRPSRAHATLILPDGRLATTDLGLDLLRIWRYEPGRGLVADHEVALPFGSGPRHLAQHGSGHVYVLTEFSIEVIVLRPDPAGRYAVIRTVPATAEGAREGDSAAEITIDKSGRFVHVTVRSSNPISTLLVRQGGDHLQAVADVSCAGDWPRHHVQHGDRLHVANQLSNTVTSFRLDPKLGVPMELLGTLQVDSPTCLIPARLP
jgi:6-phosphogluconolactonase